MVGTVTRGSHRVLIYNSDLFYIYQAEVTQHLQTGRKGKEKREDQIVTLNSNSTTDEVEF